MRNVISSRNLFMAFILSYIRKVDILMLGKIEIRQYLLYLQCLAIHDAENAKICTVINKKISIG